MLMAGKMYLIFKYSRVALQRIHSYNVHFPRSGFYVFFVSLILVHTMVPHAYGRKDVSYIRIQSSRVTTYLVYNVSIVKTYIFPGPDFTFGTHYLT